MKNKLSKLMIGGILVTALVTSPKNILAQATNSLPNTYSPSYGTTINSVDNTFGWSDLLWLIPLIGIPILAYYVFVKRDQEEGFGSRAVWQGTKGGKAKRSTADIDEGVQKEGE